MFVCEIYRVFVLFWYNCLFLAFCFFNYIFDITLQYKTYVFDEQLNEWWDYISDFKDGYLRCAQNKTLTSLPRQSQNIPDDEFKEGTLVAYRVPLLREYEPSELSKWRGQWLIAQIKEVSRKSAMISVGFGNEPDPDLNAKRFYTHADFKDEIIPLSNGNAPQSVKDMHQKIVDARSKTQDDSAQLLRSLFLLRAALA